MIFSCLNFLFFYLAAISFSLTEAMPDVLCGVLGGAMK